MGELRTIGMEKSKVLEEQKRKEQAAIERRRREMIKKRKRIKKIRFFAVWTAIILLGMTSVLFLVSALTGENDEKSTLTADETVKVTQGSLVTDNNTQTAFNPANYTFTKDMYKFENSEEMLEKVENLKSSYSDLAAQIDFIIKNEEAYPENMLKLITKSPETIEFALEYPFKRGVKNDIIVDISKDCAGDGVPLLMQWDYRWGYVSYGDDIIALDGCGPTCLSMVAIALTGNDKWTPVRVARMSEQNGHYMEGKGTEWSLMYEGCKLMGLTSKEIGLSEELMVRELKEGRPIIASMSAGDFTDSGHFIVFVGYEDGEFAINDPNSRKNSSKTWSFEQIKTQIKNMWSYELVE